MSKTKNILGKWFEKNNLKIKNKKMRRKLDERNTRKLGKRDGSYYVTLPIEMVRELKWRQGQKVEFRKKGKELIIKDWK